MWKFILFNARFELCSLSTILPSGVRMLRSIDSRVSLRSRSRLAMLQWRCQAVRKGADYCWDWRRTVWRLRTTRERMAISSGQDTEERRYLRLQYDAVKRAGPTLWFSYCAQWATRNELVLQNGVHPVALNLWIWSSRLHVDLAYDSPVKRASPAS